LGMWVRFVSAGHVHNNARTSYTTRRMCTTTHAQVTQLTRRMSTTRAQKSHR
jgi:hypothetical protein